MKKSLLVMVLLIVVMTTGCKNILVDMERLAKQQQLNVEPNPLELHGNNVGFTLSAQLPVKMMKKDTKYTIEVAYASGDASKFVSDQTASTKVGSLEFDGNKYAGNNDKPKISKKLNFAYEDKHEQGYLILKGIVSRKEKSKSFGPIQIISAGNANIGVATTSRLVKSPIDGVSNANGVSPFAYAQVKRTEPKNTTTSYKLNFKQGSGRVNTATGDNGQTLNLAKEAFKSMASTFATVENIPEFTAKGVSSHSPEGRAAINMELPKQRSSSLSKEMQAMMKAFEYGKRVSKFNFEFDNKTLEATWPEFKELIQGSSLNEDQKNEVVGIVDGNDGFVEKEKKLQALSYYNTLKDEIYPKMRYAQLSIANPSTTKSKTDMENILDKIAKGAMDAGSLTENEYLYMVTQTPNFMTRVKWLEKAVTKYNTWRINNNLGAAYLDVALLTKDNAHLEKAMAALSNALSKKEAGEIYYNQGMLYLMKGDQAKAEEAFQKAMNAGAGSNPTLTGLLNGIKGYYAIKKATARDDGKYKEAYELLGNAANTVPNYFNKGLAYLLEASDYEQAKAGFNAAIKLNEKDATSYYALAVVAARQGNANDLTLNLKKAISIKSELKAKALKDVEFFKFKTNAAFRDAIK